MNLLLNLQLFLIWGFVNDWEVCIKCRFEARFLLLLILDNGKAVTCLQPHLYVCITDLWIPETNIRLAEIPSRRLTLGKHQIQGLVSLVAISDAYSLQSPGIKPGVHVSYHSYGLDWKKFTKSCTMQHFLSNDCYKYKRCFILLRNHVQLTFVAPGFAHELLTHDFESNVIANKLSGKLSAVCENSPYDTAFMHQWSL